MNAPEAGGGTPTLAIADDGTACITLARPAQLNRLHREDLLALQAKLDAQVASEACQGEVVLEAAATRVWRPLRLKLTVRFLARLAARSVLMPWSSATLKADTRTAFSIASL